MYEMSEKLINVLQKKKKRFLFKVADILEENNIEFFLSFGTLLGAIREKNFIIWDNDIDLGFKTNYFSKNPGLWKKIIKEFDKYQIIPNVVWFNHASTSILYKYDNSANVYNTIYGRYKDNISMDVYFYRKRNDKYFIDLEGVQYFFPEKFIDTLDEITFLGRKFNVPKNPIGYLKLVYGKSWKTPKFKFKGINAIQRKEIREIEYKHIMPYYKKEE